MNIKNYTIWDIGLIKSYVALMVLFLVSVWPGFANWVVNTHWAIFLVIGIILVIKPLIKTFKE